VRKNVNLWMAILAVALLVGCSGQWSGDGGSGRGRNKPHATEDEMRQAFEKLMSAFANRNTQTMNDMMTSDAVFIDTPVDPSVLSWSDARPKLEHAFAHGSPFALSNDPNYRIAVNRDLGWIATVYHVRTAAANGIIKNDGAVSVLFQKTDGGYKVLMFHASRFPAPPTVTPLPSDKAGKKK